MAENCDDCQRKSESLEFMRSTIMTLATAYTDDDWFVDRINTCLLFTEPREDLMPKRPDNHKHSRRPR